MEAKKTIYIKKQRNVCTVTFDFEIHPCKY